ILEATGRFAVEVTEHPEQLTAERLAPFDVIVGNWNSWGSGPDSAPVKEWPAATREAYVAFLRGGKGQVMVHAGASSFYDWPDYQQAGLAAWGLGQTQHGPMHEFPVRLDSLDHPVVAGLRNFHTTDELWVRPAVQPGAQVLASAYASADHPQGSGQWEPTALAAPFGEGRCFTLLLGHNAPSMDNPGFQALLTRGTEWAATGRVTIKPPTGADHPPTRE
ncbi:MAG: ThuA domain-containing protein, partial [Verrucomicrobiae bacterium]|nr:ThuA domain-containing protein [Verrucomicrobiae bacterium]